MVFLVRPVGDFNIDLLKFQNHRKTETFIDLIFSKGYLPAITKPTRITEHSATLLDHIYTNKINKSYNSGILISDVSDHFATFTICYDKHIHKANPNR